MIEELEVRHIFIALAEQKMWEMGRLRGSITEGEGTVHGFLGEFLIAEKIGAKIENTYDYDMVKNGWRIDAKTKRCTSLPHYNYECSIAAANTKQCCDYYVFVRILEDFSQAWSLGVINKNDYFKLAMFRRKGGLDPNSNPRKPYYFKADCYNLPITNLKKLSTLG